MSCCYFRVIWVAIFLLGLSPNDAFTEPSQTSITKILAARESFDGKEVAVSGKISSLRLKTSKRGNTYSTLILSQRGGRDALSVYFQGHAQVKDGQTVKVIGKYRKEKKVGKYTFRNQIEANDIKQE